VSILKFRVHSLNGAGVRRAATGCRRHVKAFQAAYAVIRSSAPGCELSVTTTVPLPVSNVVLA
jgi:hypothetical protein